MASRFTIQTWTARDGCVWIAIYQNDKKIYDGELKDVVYLLADEGWLSPNYFM